MPLKLTCTTKWKCGETSSIYTRKSGIPMAYLARPWAKELPSLNVWE